jgi:hypothetical protein
MVFIFQQHRLQRPALCRDAVNEGGVVVRGKQRDDAHRVAQPQHIAKLHASLVHYAVHFSTFRKLMALPKASYAPIAGRSPAA